MRLLLAAAALVMGVAFAGIATSGTLVVNPHPSAEAAIDLHAWCEDALRACWDMDPASLGVNPVTSAIPPVDPSVAGGEWEAGHHLGLKLLGQHVIVNAGAEASTNVSNGADDAPAQVPCDDPDCPDLIGDPTFAQQRLFLDERTFATSSCAVQENATSAGTRRLLRFTYVSPNIGLGDLKLGDPSQSPQWFEWGVCHGHWHFQDYAAYRLWDVAGFAAWQAVRASHPGVSSEDVLEAYPELSSHLVAGHKQGFCLRDLRPWSPPAGLLYPKQFRSCATDQGISPFWADEYGYYLDGQWVDVTGLPAGAYVLEMEVNPDRIYRESVYDNNASALVVTL